MMGKHYLATLRQIAFVTGIAISISVFGLFVYWFLPALISGEQWDRLDREDITEEDLYEIFSTHPAYVAMYERFPDAQEQFGFHRHGNGGSMVVGAMNIETGNTLTVTMHYDSYGSRVNGHVTCQHAAGNEHPHGHHDLLFAKSIIETTDCLE